jgi:hypothetical protein
MVARYVNGWRDVQYQSKLDAVCTELAAYVAQMASTEQGRSRDDPEVSYRAARRVRDTLH